MLIAQLCVVKQTTADEIGVRRGGSERCISDRRNTHVAHCLSLPLRLYSTHGGSPPCSLRLHLCPREVDLADMVVPRRVQVGVDIRMFSPG